MASKWLIAAEAGLAARSLSGPPDNSDVSDNSPAGTGAERANVTNVAIVRPPEEKPTSPPHGERRGQTAFSGDVSALADNSSDDIERAAIMAEGGGADLSAPQDWPALYRESLATFRVLHPEQEAEQLARGHMVNRWHMEHGERVPPHLCAGCREPIADARTLDLADGCRVHDDAESECLLKYGQRWRGAAARALEAAGCPSRESMSAQITEFPTSRRSTGT
jgi:hypothetical protein